MGAEDWVEIDRLRTTVESLNIALEDKDGDLGSAYADVRRLRKELEEAQQYREAYLANGEAYQRQLAELRKELEEANEAYSRLSISARKSVSWWSAESAKKDAQLARLEAAWPCEFLCASLRCRECGCVDYHLGCSLGSDSTVVDQALRGTCNCNREENFRKARDEKA